MPFKENLLKKIEINRLTAAVLNSIGPPDSGSKIDRENMRSLLEMSSFHYRRERDLDLYILHPDSDKRKILVLDNELAIYNTTAEDVGLRKSPTLKEMISIRNAIKILNDSDVVVSKKKDSVKTIQKECISMLDLSFKESDLDSIEKDGVASLKRGYMEGVLECLDLFAEILGYTSPPKTINISNHKIIGALTKKESGEIMFGPMVVYSIIHNFIKLIDKRVGSFDKEKIEFIHQVAMGNEDASCEGPYVFQYLKEVIVKQNIRDLAST